MPSSAASPRRTAWLAAAVLALPLAAAAQPRPSGPYERARALVEGGRGAQGRALVDSLLAAAPAGSAARAEALWWRAALAPEAETAERDLRTLVVDYGFSPRAADATLRLAQLDLARRQPAAARQRLERLLRDAPPAPVRARTQYWLARVHVEEGDPPGACAALNAAAALALPGDPVARDLVALRRRLATCELTVAVGAGEAPRGETPRGETPRAEPPRTEPPRTEPPAPRPTPAPRDTSMPPAAPPATAPATAPAAAPGFTVQLAAYTERPPAEALAERLGRRLPYPVRVSGTAAPFRVRVGRWPARRDAVAAQRELAAKGLKGFVVEAEP